MHYVQNSVRTATRYEKEKVQRQNNDDRESEERANKQKEYRKNSKERKEMLETQKRKEFADNFYKSLQRSSINVMRSFTVLNYFISNHYF